MLCINCLHGQVMGVCKNLQEHTNMFVHTCTPHYLQIHMQPHIHTEWVQVKAFMPSPHVQAIVHVHIKYYAPYILPTTIVQMTRKYSNSEKLFNNTCFVSRKEVANIYFVQPTQQTRSNYCLTLYYTGYISPLFRSRFTNWLQSRFM